MTPQEKLVREVARGIAWNDRPYPGPDNPITLSEWVDDNWEDYTDHAKAAIAIVVERCAGICEQAAAEADEKLNQAGTENSARNFASAHATSKVLAMAIRALAEEQA